MSFLIAAAAWQGLTRAVQMIGSFLLAIAPGLIVLSFAMSAVMWVAAGHKRSLAEKAQDQFKRTVIATVVIGGYYTIKALATLGNSGMF